MHPSYPCYYYTCNQVAIGIDLANTPAYKCSEGFIFDEVTQLCSHNFPGKSCNEDDISKQIKVVFINDDHSIATTTSAGALVEPKDYKEAKFVTKHENTIKGKDSRKDYLLKILSNFGLSTSLKNVSMLNLTHKSEANKLNLTDVPLNEKYLNLKPINSTIEQNINKTELKQLESYRDLNENGAYAYIIVPVKVPQIKETQKSINLRKHEVVSVPRDHVDEQNLKSFQSINKLSNKISR